LGDKIDGSADSTPEIVSRVQAVIDKKNIKTITLKNLLLVLLIIIVVLAIFFLYLYRQGNPFGDLKPALPMTPPHFLYSIYEGKNKFLRPIAIAVDSSGDIFVSNNGVHTVEVLSPGGKPKTVIGKPGDKPGETLFPYGVGFLPNGNLAIAETGNYRIQEFTKSGKYIRTILHQKNGLGISKPGPVLVDSKGRIYISDLSGSQVVVVDQAGTLLRRIKQVSYPHGIAIDEERDRLYITDSGEVSVKVFTLEGKSDKPLKTIDRALPESRFSMVRGLAVDRLGRLYVADTITSVIRVFDKNGEYLFSFGAQGMEEGGFVYPNGLFIDNSGKIYIADWGNNRIQVWGY
jgi:sugar lactone lactonase YvrE